MEDSSFQITAEMITGIIRWPQILFKRLFKKATKQTVLGNTEAVLEFDENCGFNVSQAVNMH